MFRQNYDDGLGVVDGDILLSDGALFMLNGSKFMPTHTYDPNARSEEDEPDLENHISDDGGIPRQIHNGLVLAHGEVCMVDPNRGYGVVSIGSSRKGTGNSIRIIAGNPFVRPRTIYEIGEELGVVAMNSGGGSWGRCSSRPSGCCWNFSERRIWFCERQGPRTFSCIIAVY